MSKPAAQDSTPQPNRVKASQDNKNQRAIFFGAVIDMSWQMAIVVLIPIVGGFKLDEYLDTTPWLTIIGFLLAMAGAFVVMRRMMIEQGGPITKSIKKKTKERK